MRNYRKKIEASLQKLNKVIEKMNQSNSDIIFDWRHDLLRAEELLLNPFQTVPAERYIQITSSFCDSNSDSTNCDDDHIDIDREISAAMLYTILTAYVKLYDPKYRLQVSLQDLEDWLNMQKALLKTTHKDEEIIEGAGLTIADYKTNYGSIDFFIEFAVCYPEETWVPTEE